MQIIKVIQSASALGLMLAMADVALANCDSGRRTLNPGQNPTSCTPLTSPSATGNGTGSSGSLNGSASAELTRGRSLTTRLRDRNGGTRCTAFDDSLNDGREFTGFIAACSNATTIQVTGIL